MLYIVLRKSFDLDSTTPSSRLMTSDGLSPGCSASTSLMASDALFLGLPFEVCAEGSARCTAVFRSALSISSSMRSRSIECSISEMRSVIARSGIAGSSFRVAMQVSYREDDSDGSPLTTISWGNAPQTCEVIVGTRTSKEKPKPGPKPDRISKSLSSNPLCYLHLCGYRLSNERFRGIRWMKKTQSATKVQRSCNEDEELELAGAQSPGFTPSWESHRTDSNRRPLDYESRALPLSYGGD